MFSITFTVFESVLVSLEHCPYLAQQCTGKQSAILEYVLLECADHSQCVQIHPIFMLSIVDTLLSVLWISGALVWLAGEGFQHYDHLRVGCFAITCFTAVRYSYIGIASFPMYNNTIMYNAWGQSYYSVY